jgi:hypothetical protein
MLHLRYQYPAVWAVYTLKHVRRVCGCCCLSLRVPHDNEVTTQQVCTCVPLWLRKDRGEREGSEARVNTRSYIAKM